MRNYLISAGSLLFSVVMCPACGSSGGSSTDGGASDDSASRHDSRASVDGHVSSDGKASTDSGGKGGSDGALRDAFASHDVDVSFESGSTTAPVVLGTAADYVILAKTAISTVSPSVITGALGISPAAATYITGFSLIADSTNTFSTSSEVTGKVYAADYQPPTPSNLTTAVGDMQTAFTAAAGRAPDVTGLGAGSIGGMTLHAGVYAWGTGLHLATDVTLVGNATDVWVFQIAKNLTVSDGAHVVLSGGAVPGNVFWQVSGDVTLGTTVHFEGTILCHTGIALNTGASITGRLLAQTAVTLDANTVVAPP